jgi:hypothetical protein
MSDHGPCNCAQSLELQTKVERLEAELARLRPDCPCPDCTWKVIQIREQEKEIKRLKGLLGYCETCKGPCQGH